MISIPCIIVGSDVSMVSLLEKYTRRIGGIHIVATFTDSIGAVEFTNTYKPALVMLDKQMPDMSSVDFLTRIKEPLAVVLVGDNLEDFPVGITAAIVGFVEKPVKFEHLEECIQRAREWILKQGIGISPEYLFFRVNRKMVRVTLHNILYIESSRDYVIFHCIEKLVKIRLPMVTLERQLNEANFLRIHKSFIIAIDRIESFSSLGVEIKGIELPIGRSYHSAVFSTLSERLCLK